jgi:ribosome biogenesis GTPase A
MAKARRLLTENLKLIDLVVEILDARIPKSSRNPLIHELLNNKPQVVFLNKSDLADSGITQQWKAWFERSGLNSVIGNSSKGKGIRETLLEAKRVVEESGKLKFNRDVRIMIVGIPNVGKSSFINRISSGGKAKTGNKPGVTRGKQWINTNFGVSLLDTPGVLWPKFEDQQVGIKLALTGAVKDELLDFPELSLVLIEMLKKEYPTAVKKLYDFNNDETNFEILNGIGKNRGFLLKGGVIDFERAAKFLVDEFRKGSLGPISLEKPNEATDLT